MQVTMLYEKTPCEELQVSNCVKTRHHAIVVGKTANQLWFQVIFEVMSFKTMGNIIGQVSVACPT